MLGIPAKLADLAKMNGLDIDYNVRVARARRAVIRNSDVTRGNRMAERHPGGRGGFWLVHDFASSSGDQDLFERPLGPKASNLVRAPFKPDLQRVMFALPNGFLAYALYDMAGNLIEQVPPGVDKPAYSGAEALSVAGVGCFSCHAGGIKSVRDDYRAQAVPPESAMPAAAAVPAAGGTPELNPAPALADPGKEVREAALQLAATDGELLLLMGADNERYRNGLVTAGIDPALTLAGDEIVTALARRYASGTDFGGAAIELGLDRPTFEAALSKAGGQTAVLARRLQHGRRPRAEIDELFAYLKGAKSPETSTPAANPNPKPSVGRIDLDLWIDNARPVAGDVIVLNAQADTDCYLTVINVDAAGKATVIFPNDFELDNLISAGKPARVPGADAPYQLRRKEPGREMIYATCSTSAAPPTGVEHEFGRQRFTVLGDWEKFIEDALVTEADLRSNPQKAERARRTRALAMRRERGQRGVADRADTAPGRTLQDGRSVFVIE